jgi:hypothetical protein
VCKDNQLSRLQVLTKPSKSDTGFTIKPSGTCAHSNPSTDNLQTGGDKGNNSSKRYSFKKSAFDSLVAWLVHGYKWPECRHIVFTIQENEYYSQIAGLDERQGEKYWQKQFKNCLELLRYYNIIKGEYSWVKERQKNGCLHWHFIHHGYMDFKAANTVWSNCIRKTNGPPKYSNCVRHKKGFAKLKDQSPEKVAKYFGRYFQDGKGEYYYTKAYRIQPLPDKVANGKVRVTQEEFNSVRGSQVAKMDYATIYKTDLNEYTRIINQRTEPEQASPDFSKCSGGLRNRHPFNTKGTRIAYKLYTTTIIEIVASYDQRETATSIQERRGGYKAGERKQATGVHHDNHSHTIQPKGQVIRSFRGQENDYKRLCRNKDI